MPKPYPEALRNDVVRVALEREEGCHPGTDRQGLRVPLAAPVTVAELTKAHRANALVDAHLQDPEFDYRLLTDEAAEAGVVMAERTSWWL